MYKSSQGRPLHTWHTRLLAAQHAPNTTRVQRGPSGAHDVVVGRQLVRPAALDGACFAALRALKPLRAAFGREWPAPHSVRRLRHIRIVCRCVKGFSFYMYANLQVRVVSHRSILLRQGSQKVWPQPRMRGTTPSLCRPAGQTVRRGRRKIGQLPNSDLVTLTGPLETVSI